MVSIVIPTLNEGKVLPRTLSGIFSQTYKDIEVILVNDASTDTTDEAVKPFLDRITYIRHDKNVDKQISRNEGIAASRGEYILVCDADIQMQPTMIEKMVRSLEENPDCSFAYSSFKWEWKVFKSFPFDVERLKKMNYINTAALVRRQDHPGFDPEIKKFQDWDVWLTLVGQGRKGCYVPEVLFTVGENLKRSGRPGVSKWLPKIIYRIPWGKLGIKTKKIDEYEKWKTIVQRKHRILPNLVGKK